MNIEMRPITSIRPYENNPRLNDAAVDAVAASIQKFGFRQPIVVDSDGVIVVGHTRYKAALKLGLTLVPVHVAHELTPAEAKAFRIADNQTATLSSWDEFKLPQELAGLQDMQFELDFTGFNPQELERLLNATASPGSTDPDTVPAPPDAATTQPGDLIVLGKHQLLCDDSSKPEAVDRLLVGAKVHTVNTDPPYNVRVEPRSNNAIAAGLSSFPRDERKQKKLLNKTHRTDGLQHHQALDLARQPHKATPTSTTLRAKDRPLTNDFISDEEFDRLLDAWFGNMARVLLPGRAF